VQADQLLCERSYPIDVIAVPPQAEETLKRCLAEASSGTMVVPVSPQLEKIINPFPLGERKAAE
jgi:hypothetical protein